MKKLMLIVVLLTMSACSSAPRKVLMKNCESAGSGLFYCEEIPQKEVGKLK